MSNPINTDDREITHLPTPELVAMLATATPGAQLDAVRKELRIRGVKTDLERPTGPPQRVVITDIDMPFGSMVSFIFKWSLASIPVVLLWLILVAMLYSLRWR